MTELFNVLNFVKKKNDQTNMATYIDEIEKLLKISCPQIVSVACIFESYLDEYGKDMVLSMPEFYPDELPEDARFSGAYFFDDQNLILVAKKYPMIEFGKSERIFMDLTKAEMLYLIAHELRHVWQHKYAHSTYYNHNAVKLENLNDVAEIDADAFAFSYVFSDQTSYNYTDFPAMFDEICLLNTADKGKRLKRMKEISAEYNLNTSFKAEEARANIDHDKISPYLNYMRLTGMI